MITILLCLVVGVADGDTLTVLCEGSEKMKIRLSEIDAPEKRQLPLLRRVNLRKPYFHLFTAFT